MIKDQSVRDAVREILENVQASGQPLPSIRALLHELTEALD